MLKQLLAIALIVLIAIVSVHSATTFEHRVDTQRIAKAIEAATKTLPTSKILGSVKDETLKMKQAISSKARNAASSGYVTTAVIKKKKPILNAKKQAEKVTIASAKKQRSKITAKNMASSKVHHKSSANVSVAESKKVKSQKKMNKKAPKASKPKHNQRQ